MSRICPTVTTDDPDKYNQQIEQVQAFANRLHIDLADGIFTGNKLTQIKDVWWPDHMTADLHVMYQRPFEHVEAFIALAPRLVIVHAEADGDFGGFANTLHEYGVRIGVAIKPSTMVDTIAPALGLIDHVLIFSGNLGHFGGHADVTLLSKARQLRALKPSLEIGWDGGINETNVRTLADGGIDILNVGGFIHNATNPQVAYATLMRAIE